MVNWLQIKFWSWSWGPSRSPAIPNSLLLVQSFVQNFSRPKFLFSLRETIIYIIEDAIAEIYIILFPHCLMALKNNIIYTL